MSGPLNNLQFGDDDWDFDAPLESIPSLDEQRARGAQRPDPEEFNHAFEAQKATGQWSERVRKYGDDPDAMQASNRRSGPHREEKKVRAAIDLEQSFPYMGGAEQMRHVTVGGEKLTGKFEGRRGSGMRRSPGEPPVVPQFAAGQSLLGEFEGGRLGARPDVNEPMRDNRQPGEGAAPWQMAKTGFAYTLAAAAFAGSIIPSGEGPRVTPISKVSR